MRLFTNVLICVAAMLPAVGLAQSATYALTLGDTTITAGETMTVSWQTNSNSRSQDWVGLYRTDARDTSYVSWQYVNAAAGTLSFTVSQPGDYEFRYFLNNGYARVAKTGTFSVTTGTNSDTNTNAGYSLTLGKTTYSPGARVTVNWGTTANNTSQDWIGLYRTNDSNQSYQQWQYINGSNGSRAFTVTRPGTYEFRYFTNNGYNRVARSQTFTVGTVVDENNDDTDPDQTASTYSLSIPRTTIDAGDSITLSWDASDSSSRDWVGLYRAGTSGTQYLQWRYVDRNNGSQAFTINTPDTYEFRYYLNGSYQQAAASSQFTVQAVSTDNDDDTDNNTDGDSTGYSLTTNKSSYAAGDIARVTWDVPHGVGFTRNWVGLYTPGATDRQYLSFEYVDFLSRTETFRLNTPGTYEFRFFTNNSYNKVATSDRVTVRGSDNTACTLDTSNITNYPPANGPIIALGDSITAGVGASSGQDYVSELEGRLGVPIQNAGVSGDTTRDALQRLQRDVLSKDPSAVIIFLGGNDEIRRYYDQLSGNLAERNLKNKLDELATNVGYDWMSVPLIPRDETFSDLEKIITRIQNTGAATILVGFDATIFDDRIDDNYRTIANNTGSFFVPDIYNGVFARPRYMSDLVHPNDAGYDIVANRIQGAVGCVAG